MLTIKTNIDEIITNFKKLADSADSVDYSEALLVGVNAAMAQMKFRIFNNGLDNQLVSFGKYTGKKKGLRSSNKVKISKMRIAEALDLEDGLSDYEKKRLRAGRQVGYKDLEFTGDLRRGVVDGKVSNIKVICWIPNDDLFKIAKYQEEQIGKIRGETVVIFSLTEDERLLVVDNTKEALKQIYDRLFNSK